MTAMILALLASHDPQHPQPISAHELKAEELFYSERTPPPFPLGIQ